MGDEYAEDSLSQALADAWDETEKPEETSDADTGDGAEAPEDEPAPGPADVEASADPEAETDQPEEPVSDVEPQAEAAPSSLPPAAREVWSDTPKAMQEAIAKREHDYELGIRKYAENAKRAEAMDQTLAPYAQLLQMNGGPGNTIKNLLDTAAGLQMGTPMQKAQVAAKIINDFGVDIATLDSLLVGGDVPRGTQVQSDVQQAVHQAVAPYQQFMNQFQQQQQAQMQQAQGQVQSELEAFANDPQHEFYNDVKLDMADIMEMASKRGQNMTLQEAYDRAVTMHPEISKIIGARQQQRSVAEKQQAAASISGSPGGPGTTSEPDTLHAAIERAWETAGRV